MFLAFFLFHSFSQQLITANDRFAKIDQLTMAVEDGNDKEIEKLLNEFKEIDSNIHKNKPFRIETINGGRTKSVNRIETKKGLFLPANPELTIKFYKEETVNRIVFSDIPKDCKITVKDIIKNVKKSVNVDENGKLESPITTSQLVIFIKAKHDFQLGQFDFE